MAHRTPTAACTSTTSAASFRRTPNRSGSCRRQSRRDAERRARTPARRGRPKWPSGLGMWVQYLPIRSFLRHFRSLSWAFFLALSRPLLGPYPRSPIAILSFQTAVTRYKLVTLSRGQGEGHHRFVDLPTPSILWPRVRILRTPSNMLMAYNHLIVIKYHFVNVPVKEWPCYYLLKSFWLREQDGKEV